MRGILEHSISAGVVSDDEKNAFPSMNHLGHLDRLPLDNTRYVKASCFHL